MLQTPFRHDASASRHYAAQTFVRKVYVLQTYAGVYGEIVNTLFALFYQRVTVDFPREVFNLSVNFLQSLIDGHSADGDRAVAHYPFACLVYVLAC